MAAHAFLKAGLVKVLRHWIENFKEEELEFGLDAPVRLKRGTVGHLSVKAGFASLTTAEVNVEVEDVDLVLSPLPPKELLAKEYQAARALATHQTQPAEPMNYAALFGLAVKVIRGITITIKNVRIHYEDTVTVPSAPILIGITVKSITSHTADGWFRGRALSQPIEIEGLSVYMNTDWRAADKHNEAEIAERLDGLYRALPHYILSPCSLSAKLFCCPMQANVPQIIIRIHTRDLQISLEQDQYSAMLALGELVRGFSRRAAHKLQRPTVPVKGHAMVWWRFVVQCVKEDVRLARQELWTRAFSRKRRERQLYISLERKNLEGRLEPAELKELRELELNFQLAELQELHSAATRFTDIAAPDVSPPRSQFAPEEIKRLERDLDLELPEGRTHQLVTFAASKFAFLLKGEKSNTPVVGLVAEDISTSYCAHQVEWRTIALAVKSFAVADYYSAPGKAVNMLMPRRRNTNVPLLNVKHEMHPLNRHDDFALEMQMQVVDLIFSRGLVDAIVRFFLSPRYSPLLELSDKAKETLSIIEQTVENRVRFALMYHEIISVNAKIDQPRVFLPAAFGRPAPTVVAELGPITIESELRPREAARAINTESLADSGQGNELVYDAYSVTLDLRNMYLITTTLLEGEHGQPNEFPTIRKVVDSFSTTITLHVLNIDVPRLPFVKLTGSLPVIGIYVRREDVKEMAAIAGELLFSDAASTPAGKEMQRVREEPNTAAENTYQALHIRQKDSSSQHSFRLDVSIDTVFLKVFSRANDESCPPTDLFVATWKGFVLGLDIADVSTEINASLRAFYIENLPPQHGGSNVQRYILRSQPHRQMDDLITVNYISIAPSAPFYTGVDNIVDLSVTGISFRVTSDVVALLLQLIDDLAAAFIEKSDEKTRSALPATASNPDAGKLDKKSRASLLHLSASFGMMEVLLDDGPNRIASVALSDSRMCLELYYDMTIRLEAKLGVLEVLNYDPCSSAWREIVRMENKSNSLIELKYRTISPPKDGYEASLEAVVNNVTVVALTSFFFKIYGLVTLMLEDINPAVLPLPKLGESAPPAKQKQWLDFRLLVQNPLVIVPRNGSSSSEWLQLDLGRIYVYTKPTEGRSVLSLEVEDFNVRTMLPGLVTPLPLLKNTALLLHLVQSQDPNVTDVDPSVRSDVPSLHVTVSDRQLALLINVVNENLMASMVGSEAKHAQQREVQPAKSNLNLSFRLVHLTIDLFTHPDGCPPWETRPLVSLNVGQVLAELNRVCDESLIFTASMRMVVLDDMRPDVPIRAVRTLLTTKSLEREAISLRLVVPGKTNEVRPPELYATIVALHLCVLAEPMQEIIAYIGRLSTMNTKQYTGVTGFPLATAPVMAAPEPAITFPLQMAPVSQPSKLPFGRLRLSLQGMRVSLPGIRVPTPDSLGVIAEIEAEFSLEHKQETSRLEMEISKLAARRSSIARMEPSATLIRPFALRMAADLTPATGELKGALDIEEVSVLVTYSDYLLISRLSTHAAAAFTAPATDLAPAAPVEPSSPLDGLLALVGARQMTLSLRADSGLLTVVEDCTVCPVAQKSVSQPLARLTWSRMCGNIASPPMALGIMLHLGVSYWNPRQTAWEPFMEEWQLKLEFVSDAKVLPMPQETHDPERQQPLAPPLFVTRFQIKGLSPLEFTVTSPMIESATRYLISCREEDKRMKALEASNKESDQVGMLAATMRQYHPWVVVNSTGVPLVCGVTRDDELIEPARMLAVQEEGVLRGVEQEAYTRSSIGDSESIGVDAMNLAVRLQSGEEIGSLPFGRCCIFAVPLGVNRTFVYELEYASGRTTVRLRSNLLVYNRTRQDLCLRVLSSDGKVTHECRIKPNEKYGAPLESVESARISVAPHETGHSWSHAPLDLASPPTSPLLLPCNAVLQERPPFSYVARVVTAKLAHTAGSSIDYRLRISPPLMVVNLLCAEVLIRLGRGPFSTEGSLKPGEKLFFHEADFAHSVWMSIKVPGYQWSGEAPLHKNHEERDIIQLVSEGCAPDLGVHYDNRTRKQGHRKLVLFTPYWLVNDTTLPLEYSRASHTLNIADKIAPAEEEDPFGAPLSGPVESRPVSWSSTQLSLRVGSNQWSAPISIDKRHQEESAVDVPATKRQSWSLVLSASQPPRKFWRSTVLTLRFAYVLVNDSTEPLAFRQAFSTAELHLPAGHATSWHWRDLALPHELRVTKSARSALTWSSAFSLDMPKPTFDLNLWTALGGKEMVRVQMRRSNGSTMLVFRARPEFSQFRIENRCKGLDVILRQKMGKEERVAAGTETSFAWDHPDLPVREQLLQVYVTRESEEPTFLGEYGFHKFKRWSNVPVAGLRGTLAIEVLASGPTRVLLLTDSRSRDPPVERGLRELEGCIELSSLGISVVDHTPQELCYFSMQRIALDVLRNSLDKSVDLRVGAIQVDNSLPATAFPVLFATQSQVEEKGKEAMPAVHISLCKGTAYKEMSYYRYMGFALQPCIVKFDELFVLASVNFVSAMYDFVAEYWQSQEFEQYANNAAALVDPDCLSARRIFFDLLEIQSLKVQVTFLTLPHLAAGSAVSERSLWIERLLSRVGLLANVDGELSLNALELERAYGPGAVVTGLIMDHFQKQVYRQWLRLIGSSVLLGAPTVLWTSVAHGFRDLVNEPAHSHRSAKGISTGLARGARSLGQHTVYGVANTFSLVTSNVARALGKASFDRHYQANRELAQVLQRPANPGQGAVAGGTALGRSIGAAVKGVVSVPRAQMRRKSRMKPAKVVGSVGAGVLGLIVKPLAGAFDLVSLCSEGVKNLSVPFANASDARKRVRPPRHFDETGALHDFSLVDAAAQYLLRTAKRGHFLQQVYLYGRPIGERHWLILSTELLLRVSLRKDGSVKQVKGISAESVIEIRNEGEDHLIVCFNPSEAPQGPMKGVRSLTSPPRSSPNAAEDDQSASSLSGVLPSTVVTSEWPMNVTIVPAAEVANAMQERLLLYRTERAPLCPPSGVHLSWNTALTQADVKRIETTAAHEVEQKRRAEQEKENVAFAGIAHRCEVERSELRKQMAKQRRMPVRESEEREKPKEVPMSTKVEQRHQLEQTLAVLEREEEKLVETIEVEKSQAQYQNKSFSDVGAVLGVNMSEVQRVDAAPVERRERNPARFADRSLQELEVSLAHVKTESTKIRKTLHKMEYHQGVNPLDKANELAETALARSHHKHHDSWSMHCIGRRAATASPVVAFWFFVLLLVVCWKTRVWQFA